VAFRFVAPTNIPSRHYWHFPAPIPQQIEALFVGLWRCWAWRARWGCCKLGTVVLDGTKIHANASHHSGLSYEHANKIEAQLQGKRCGADVWLVGDDV
jgi:hypothetical protein